MGGIKVLETLTNTLKLVEILLTETEYESETAHPPRPPAAASFHLYYIFILRSSPAACNTTCIMFIYNSSGCLLSDSINPHIINAG